MEVLAVLIAQGAIVPCKRCRVVFKAEDLKAKNVQKEHLHELAIGGKDQPDNCAYSHTDCHKVITNGNGATTAGSSSNRRAKANNPGRIEKFRVDKKPLVLPVGGPVHARCGRCGQYADECACPPVSQRSSFGRKKA
jgi:hypothetical protein